MKNILLLITACCSCLMPVLAQTDVYNAGVVQLQNSADTFYITGSLSNTSTASFRNLGGNLYVLQNLNNDETNMLAGGGKLWFKGAALQNVTGTQPFRTYNWIVNNAAGANLQNRVGIGDGTGGSLSFTNGLITSGTLVQDVLFYPNSGYTGFADNRHIVGYCSKTGSTDFTFPIGNGSLQADLDIFNLASSTTFQCKYFGTGYGTYTPQSPLVSVFQKEYWTLDRTAGSSAAQITLKWNDARNPLNHTAPADLRAGHFTGGIWINEGGTGSGNSTLGTVSSVAVNSFSPFTFASVGVALPIKITGFSATVNADCSVYIKWDAFDETGVSAYTIQKSSDGTNWDEVTSFAVTSSAVTSTARSFTDIKTIAGAWAYRVKVINKDGSPFYTAGKAVQLRCNNTGIAVYPAVTNGLVSVVVNNTMQLKAISIYNQKGQLMQNTGAFTGSPVLLHLNGYAAGQYTIIVVTANSTQSFKIIKAGQ